MVMVDLTELSPAIVVTCCRLGPIWEAVSSTPDSYWIAYSG